MFDLLDIKLSSLWKIESDCVEDDLYALENLISSDESKRRIGFMAYSVSKPPISITLEFKHKINFKMLKVHSSLQSLKSTKFQVLVEVQENDRKFFRKIEEISLNDEHQGFILKTSDTQHNQDNLKAVDIHQRFNRNLRNLSTIKIIILDSWMRRAPVIKKIEIWGEPSTANSKEDIDEILRLKNKIINKTDDNLLKHPQDDFDEQFKIPEDFLDAITHELLTMPYILPSGAIVDETTLEKHKRNEESYGRFPSDPFTGVLFNSESHPKFDVSLKMRLDEFKLKHSHEIDVKNSGRTVGRKVECQPSTSKSVSHISKKIKLSNESSLDDLIKSIYESNQISNYTTPKTSQNSDPSKQCCSCKSNSNLYKITTCEHIYCKDCLIKLSSTCTTCNADFENKNVMRIHL